MAKSVIKNPLLTVEQGGTGATTAANARKNLGLEPKTFSINALSGGTIQQQNNVKVGDICYCTFRVQTTVAEGTNATCWNIPSGYRPKANVYTYAVCPDINHMASVAVTTNGNILIGINHKTNQTYNLLLHYSCV